MQTDKSMATEIENLRLKMEKSAKDKGFTHEKTLILSTKLDRLLNKYMNKKINL